MDSSRARFNKFYHFSLLGTTLKNMLIDTSILTVPLINTKLADHETNKSILRAILVSLTSRSV